MTTVTHQPNHGLRHPARLARNMHSSIVRRRTTVCFSATEWQTCVFETRTFRIDTNIEHRILKRTGHEHAHDFSTCRLLDRPNKGVNLASSLARDTGGTLVIVHVEEPALAYSTDGAYYGAANPQHDDLVKMLHEVVPSASDVEYEYRILSGLPADAIVQCAEAINAEFIVMGTHGRTGFSRMLMGSVAEAVVRHAPCPVVTVKEGVRESSENAR